eukprot:10520847-Heterocapsa_arctica.AAC.1
MIGVLKDFSQRRTSPTTRQEERPSPSGQTAVEAPAVFPGTDYVFGLRCEGLPKQLMRGSEEL